eukprot:TRINITY_DN26897_c0_g1_i1.p1 TRINITY_DN26897_c0_g1~~TRINITY_DN26897_c0_g1_i1.p1  ORF type:complete len:352 (+),score=77.72 TRINITY_DN26897_c0_g1_i1:177-1232(+)
MMDEAAESAIVVQKAWRGHSSRERTMHQLEVMMTEEVGDTAERISSSLKKADRSQVEDSPRSDRELSPRTPGDLSELSGYVFESTDVNNVKGKLLEIQGQASKLQSTVDELAPVFLEHDTGAAPSMPRPWATLQKHDSLDTLQVSIVGLTPCGRAVATCLCRAGVASVTIVQTRAGPSAHTTDTFVDSLSSGNAQTKVSSKAVNASDVDAFLEATKDSGLIILCSDQRTDRRAVTQASSSTGVPWVLLQETPGSATFRYQFFCTGVVDVLEHDVVAAPTIQHTLKPDVAQQLQGLAQTVLPNAAVTFAGLLAHSVVMYWLGAGEVRGYLWYCASFNQFSSIPLSELRQSPY